MIIFKHEKKKQCLNVLWFITLDLNTTCALFEEILFCTVTNVPRLIKVNLYVKNYFLQIKKKK